MYCTNCGSDIPDGSAFCGACGAPQSAGAPAGAPAGAAPPPGTAMPAGAAPPPGGVATMAPPAPAPAPPPRKKRGCLVAALVLVGLLVLCCGGFAVAGSFLGKPRDLGVRYTEKDYESGMAKLGLDEFDNGYGKPVEGTQMVYSGSKKIDVELTEAEVSALLSLRHSPRWPVSQVQVRLKGGNQAEASGLVSYQGINYPVYVDGTASLAGPRSVGGNASAIEVGGVAFPAEYWPQAQSAALELINGRLSRMEGLDIQSAEVEAGKLRIKGSIPAVAKRVPVGQ